MDGLLGQLGVGGIFAVMLVREFRHFVHERKNGNGNGNKLDDLEGRVRVNELSIATMNQSLKAIQQQLDRIERKVDK